MFNLSKVFGPQDDAAPSLQGYKDQNSTWTSASSSSSSSSDGYERQKSRVSPPLPQDTTTHASKQGSGSEEQYDHHSPARRAIDTVRPEGRNCTTDRQADRKTVSETGLLLPAESKHAACPQKRMAGDEENVYLLTVPRRTRFILLLIMALLAIGFLVQGIVLFSIHGSQGGSKLTKRNEQGAVTAELLLECLSWWSF